MTKLAIATLILGGLRLILSVLAIWFLINLLTNGLEAKPRPNASRDFGDIDIIPVLAGFLLPMFALAGVAVAIVSIVGGILLVIAGMGLWHRRRFSRVLSIVLGSLGGMLALLYAYTLVDEMREGMPSWALGLVLLVGMLVHGGYCAFVFVVLLNRKNVAEFT